MRFLSIIITEQSGMLPAPCASDVAHCRVNHQVLGGGVAALRNCNNNNRSEGRHKSDLYQFYSINFDGGANNCFSTEKGLSFAESLPVCGIHESCDHRFGGGVGGGGGGGF
jgi:hypothetical protein